MRRRDSDTQTDRPRATRIAVVGGPPGPELAHHLRATRGRPGVREFAGLHGEAAALVEFAPRVLVLVPGDDAGRDLDQEIGGIRVLRSLLGGLAVILVRSGAALEPTARDACAKLKIRILDTDGGPEELRVGLAAELARALDSGRDDDYLQFVQGICDEINNPLLFASGHLQLLESRLDPHDDRDPLSQVVAIREGLDRIAATMRKVAAMGRATPARRRSAPFTLGELLDSAAEKIRAAGLDARLDVAAGDRETPLAGDLDLLAGAIHGLARVGAELSADSRTARNGKVTVLESRRDGGGLALRMQVEDARLEHWELPLAFEPYHLSSILRGTPLGLDLFLLRLVVEAHGWHAFARRLADHTVEFCIAATPDSDCNA